MSFKPLALAAITALAFSADAQVFNWNLDATTAYGGTPLGTGSGTLTVSGGIVTAMTGTLGGASVSLLQPGAFFNDNQFPVTSTGLSFEFGNHKTQLTSFTGAYTWYSATSVGAISVGPATFTYTPIPEPSTWAMGGVFGVGAWMTVAARRQKAAQV